METKRTGSRAGVSRTRQSGVRRWIIVLMLACALPMASGCYGRFPLTRLIYKINGDVSENKVIQSVVMWVFVILPVYGIATFGDAIVIHLIEFWSGNELNIGSATDGNGAAVAFTPSEDGRTALVTVSKDGTEVGRMQFVRVSDNKFEVRDTEGKLTGMVLRSPSGDLLLTDAQGVTVRTISAANVASIRGT